jgi:hypothetical protein
MDAVTHTAKRILDALAFSNVSRLDEFRALLHKIDEAASPAGQCASHDGTPPSGNSAVTPALHRVQGAL